MNTRRSWVPACLVAMAVVAAAPLGAGRRPSLTLTATLVERPAFPGDVVPVFVSVSGPVVSVQVNVFNRTLPGWPLAAGEWQGLLAVPLDTAPGRYEVVVRVTGLEGAVSAERLTLTVSPKRFETRRIRVADRFVEPPADEIARIQREARLLEEIFAASSSERVWNAPFSPPVAGPANSSFGRQTIQNGQPGSRHQGADFRAAVGAPVRAPNAGRVVLATDLFFAGNTVILDHGSGLYSLLAHLSRIIAKPGAMVTRGEIIAHAGATGRVTGPHLHWAVRLGNVSVDPLSLMAASRDLTARVLVAGTDATEH